MTTSGTIPHPGHVDPIRRAQERAALDAILASNTLQTKPRLASLLKYICERYFEGDIDAIKEYSIATDVFRRPQSFDQATDSIVRVEVFRLRKKLRQFYDGEGADQAIEIVVATGHYRPQFIDRVPQVRLENRIPDSVLAAAPADAKPTVETEEPCWTPEGDQANPEDGSHPAENALVEVHRRRFDRLGWLAFCVILVIVVAAASTAWWLHHGRHANSNGAESFSASALPTGPEVRIRCGYSRPIFKDEEGTLWTGDQYFAGGFASELRDQHIARTRNPELYLSARTGVFSYKIPLPPGTYELRLHFAETTYSPASSLGGGENSRVFDVQLNGRPLLTQFDIVSDAGANTADVRVFRDISPEKDGYLHLDFAGSLGLPILNAIEIVPGLPHRLRPIRMVAQNSFLVDKAGNLWMPDTYFSSGQLAADKVVIAGTAEPSLYSGERYGNFTYALPVDEGTYKITLYFSEKYWGTDITKQGGVGSRVFDVLCNGAALTRRLDILKEAGPAHALLKTYHDLRPNAQGKLILSFVPDVNYASVDAVEVEQEAP
jgi:Malectin domain